MLSFLLEKVALDENLMQRDGIHPNSKAQPIIANQVQEELLNHQIKTSLIKNYLCIL